MNTASVSRPAESTGTRLRFYAGDLIYTEGMPADHLYVVQDGEVDLFLVRDEKRVVVETLGKGSCFGLAMHLPKQKRTTHAVARSYCELMLIDVGRVTREAGAATELTQNLLRTQAARLAAAHDLIARRVNYQPDLQIYAQVLQLLGLADLARSGGAAAGHRGGTTASGAPAMAAPLLQDLVTNVRLMFGHSDKHIREVVGRLVALHLIQVEDGDGSGKRLKFAPRDLPAQVRKVVAANDESERLTYEYIGVDEFAAMVDVERPVLLRKLAEGDFADDVFAFRRAEILRLLNTQGRNYFAQRKIKTPEEFSDVRDLEFADAKSLFAVASAFDTLELAKLLTTLEDGPAKQKILGSLSRARRAEVDADLDGLPPADPVEAQQIGARLVKDVKAQMTRRA